MRVAIDYLDLDLSRRNILVTHQFVTGAVRSDSEEISVGGADNVDASVFEAFDYVALGAPSQSTERDQGRQFVTAGHR